MTRAAQLASRISGLNTSGRSLIAIAGPPGSGKSTLSAELVAELGPTARLVPMDGFHLDNRLLSETGMLARKGAPETFDLGGFVRLVQALRYQYEVYYPVFDRERDIAIAGAGCVDGTVTTVVLEGNYLMFDEPGWRDLAAHWDACVFLDEPMPVLRERLVQRWLDHGLDPAAAEARAEGNDIPNAQRVLAHRLHAEIEVALT